ncbi:MAG: hypothetical protein CMQ20_08035, partial [Gammaproteobacteria bacterium]|nr:hypothetical protein [Gammaproteobacteria bacterium]
MAVLAVALPIYVGSVENHTREMVLTFNEYESRIVRLPESGSMEDLHRARGSVIHFYSPTPLSPETPLYDEFFGLTAPPTAIRLRRRTEYCQWMESEVRRKVEDEHGREYTDIT